MGAAAAGWPMMAALLGSSALGGLTAPEGQELQSFKGTKMDPVKMGGDITDLLNGFLGDLMGEAAKPTTVKTTVNPLPSFVGGGLPMALSVPGMDPNRLNPELRTSPGFMSQRRTLGGDTGRTAQPRVPPAIQQSQPQQAQAQPPQAQPVPNAMMSPTQPGGEDPVAALELLIQSMGGRV